MSETEEQVIGGQSYFYIIPTDLAEAGNSTKALLYGLLVSLANTKGYCFASNKYLAKKLGKSSCSIITKYVKELSEEGWIIIELYRTASNEIARNIYINEPPARELLRQKKLKKSSVGVECLNIRPPMKKHVTPTEKTLDPPTEKTLDSNISIEKENLVPEFSNSAYGVLSLPDHTSGKNASSDIKHQTPELSRLGVAPKLDTTAKNGKINLSSVAPAEVREKRGKPKLSEDCLEILQVYKERIYKNCNERTQSVLENLPEAVKVFKEYFPEAYKQKFIEALNKFDKSWMVSDLRYLRLPSPRYFLQRNAVEKYLIPLVTEHAPVSEGYEATADEQEVLDLGGQIRFLGTQLGWAEQENDAELVAYLKEQQKVLVERKAVLELQVGATEYEITKKFKSIY